MRERRFRFGTVVSVLWLAFVAWIAFRHPDTAANMKPNEWGDFFAGCFAPLAFLWLVLGYLQQGEELQLSTKALLLQADELHRSVEHQRELVAVTRQQVESDREALELQRQHQRDSSKPLFVFKNDGFTLLGSERGYRIEVSNVGGTATDVSVVIDAATSPPYTHALFDASMFPAGTDQYFFWRAPTQLLDKDLRLSINFTGPDEQSGRYCYQLIVRENDSTYSMPSSFVFVPIPG